MRATPVCANDEAPAYAADAVLRSVSTTSSDGDPVAAADG